MQQRIKNSDKHIIIKRLTGIFILCTFLLSITPKQVLHSLCASHKDQAAGKTSTTGETQLGTAGFHCDCDSIVATSPFADVTEVISILCPTPQLIHHEELPVAAVSSTHVYFSLRGPPASA